MTKVLISPKVAVFNVRNLQSGEVSIGYRIKEWEIDEKNKIEAKEVEIMEIAIGTK